jgi:hypothetical protein
MMIKNQIFKFRENCPAPAGNPNPIRVRGQKKQGFVARSQIKKKENPGGLPEHAFEAQIYR